MEGSWEGQVTFSGNSGEVENLATFLAYAEMRLIMFTKC